MNNHRDQQNKRILIFLIATTMIGISLLGSFITVMQWKSHQLFAELESLQNTIDTNPALTDQEEAVIEIKRNLIDGKRSLMSEEIDIYQTVIQGMGGLFFAITAYLTWRNLQGTEDKQIVERFGQATQQLASEQMVVRLGGIYALERIAIDSKADYWVIIEVLTSFIKERAPQTSLPDQFLNLIDRPPSQVPEVNELPMIAGDIQAALTVLGRRNADQDPEDKILELNETNLSIRAKLADANFRKARLWETHIIQSDLRRANFSGADLEAASLCLSNLRQANFNKACLVQADLRRADLAGANLHQADLSKANLIATKGLLPDQVKQAKNWQQALYDPAFSEQLGLK
jgi:hypothetical protein